MGTKGFAATTIMWVLGAGVLIALSAAPAQAAFPGENGKIAFADYVGGGGVYVLGLVNPDGTDRTISWTAPSISRIGSHPAWSPDGKSIAVASAPEFGGIGVIAADGSNRRSLVPADTTEAEFTGYPAWSPDGGAIAFQLAQVSFPSSARPEGIYVVRTESGEQARLANSTVADTAPAWSPDGDAIAVVRLASRTEADIQLLDADGTSARPLDSTPGLELNPNWSPDGTKIAFESDRDGDFEIYSMDVNSGGLTQVTNNGVRDTNPAWSPDGTRIAFGRGFHDDIYTVSSTGGIEVNVSSSFCDPVVLAPGCETYPDWQPLPFKNASKKCKAFPGAYRNHGQCVKANR